MSILLATDDDAIHEEADAALVDERTTLHWVRAGRDVIIAVRDVEPDLVILDLQIGNMGGMAACLSLRLEEGSGRLDRHHPVLMLLDRRDDVFLAKRSEADGWLVKPLDAFRLGRAARALLAGERWTDAPDTAPTEGLEALIPHETVPTDV